MLTPSRRQFIAGLPAFGLISAHAAGEEPFKDIVFGSCLDTHEQRRLLSLLKGHTALILSGDRHGCEFSKNGVFDFTSSSMMQKHPRGTPTPNKHRIVPFPELNVG